MKTLRAPVVLDLGNVLVSVDFERFVGPVAAAAGVCPAALRERWVDGPAKLAYERGEIRSAAFFAGLAEWLDWPRARRRELIAAWTGIFAPVDGAARALTDLAARGPVWLLSDTNPLHLRACWRTWDWLGHCERRFVSWRSGRLKTEPGAFGGVVAAAGGRPADLVFLDDRADNVAAARDAGLDAHVFTGWPEARRRLGLPPVPPERPTGAR